MIEQILCLTIHRIEKLGILCRIVLNWGLCGAVSNPNLPRRSRRGTFLLGPIGLTQGQESQASLLASRGPWPALARSLRCSVPPVFGLNTSPAAGLPSWAVGFRGRGLAGEGALLPVLSSLAPW